MIIIAMYSNACTIISSNSCMGMLMSATYIFLASEMHAWIGIQHIASYIVRCNYKVEKLKVTNRDYTKTRIT